VKPAVAVGLLACMIAGCGKKGPPLPPLVKLPVAPTNLTAERRASMVDLSLTVPAANTDGTRPANVSRVEIYALTAPASTPDAVVLKQGARIASIQVKTPRDPNQTVEPDDPDTDIEQPEGPGLDQGATAHVLEDLTALAQTGAIQRAPRSAGTEPVEGPLVGPPLAAPARQYLAVGVNQRGRRGPLSKHVGVPLIVPPARGPQPSVSYDESAITVAWGSAPSSATPPPPADDAALLPSRELAITPIEIAYNVYDVPDSSTGGAATRLTNAPVRDARFVDQRLAWGAERCYAVRIVEIVDALPIEGDIGPARCVTPVDTFPPAAPKKPTAIARIGAIDILWDPNEEKDLAGYLVLRREGPEAPFTRLTPEPIDRTNFSDLVPQGFRAIYAIEAVDKAGNVSAMSPPTDEESAR